MNTTDFPAASEQPNYSAGSPSPAAPGYPARKPAEVWPVGHFIENEIDERRWTKDELVSRLGGGAERELEIDLLIFAPTKGVVLDEKLAADLARVFGTSAKLWLNIDKAWQDNDQAQPLGMARQNFEGKANE